MFYARSCSFIAALLLTGLFALGANAGIISTFDFTFTGDCDDCAFMGDPGEEGFDPFDDGLFQSVSGTLRLTDITLNGSGNIDVSSGNFDSFSYNGSSLLNPFTFTDPFTITGEISPTGAVQSALVIKTSAGNFANFCTPLGQQVLGNFACDFIGEASFRLNTTGNWVLNGVLPSDIGVNGEVSVVPEPASAVLLGLGLVLGAGVARRIRTA